MIAPNQLSAALIQQAAAYHGTQASHIHAAILRATVARLIREAQSKGLHLTLGSEIGEKK
jgi:hypothetical protein